MPNCKGEGVKLQILGKNLCVHLIVIKESPNNNSPILKSLNNYLPVHFIETASKPHLGTKEYLTCWKIIQTKLEVLSQKELTVLQNKYR